MGDVNSLIYRERVPVGGGAWNVRPPALAGITPKFCLATCIGFDSDVDDVINTDGAYCVSFTGPEASYAVSYVTLDGLSTADARSLTHGSALAAIMQPDKTYSLLVQGSTFVAGGLDCTVTWNNIRPIVTFLFLWGDDLQVHQERVAGIASGSRVITTGFSGVNDNQLAFTFGALTFGTPPTGDTDYNGATNIGLACRAGAAGPPHSQGVISFSQWLGAAGAVYQYTSSAICSIAHSQTGGVISEWEITDIQDAQWTATLTRGGGQQGFYATIISTADNQAWCALLDSPLISPWVVGGLGFEPQVVGLVVGQKETDDLDFQQGDTGILGVTVGVANGQGLACLSSEDGPGTMVAKNRQSAKFLSVLEDDGSVGWEQAAVGDFSLEADGFRVDNLILPTGTTGAKKWLAWAIQSSAPAGPVELTIEGLDHARPVDDVNVTVLAIELSVDGLHHARSVDDIVALGVEVTPFIASLDHGRVVDDIVITATEEAQADNLTKARFVDAVNVTELLGVAIDVDDITHQRPVDPLLLAVDQPITIEGLDHGRSVDGVDVQQLLGDQTAIGATASAWVLDAGQSLTNASAIDFNYHVLEGVFDSGASILGVDGVRVTGQAGMRELTALTLGADVDGNRRLDGAVAELRIYAGALTQAQRDTILQELQQKWITG